ncbi:MAG: adenylate/guanylate cyclase domain-containing protein [Thermosynechococcaceae cyanobacterium MS004]|nr:adenylate/guanylate cyclase domain-containing protein [Thermosynechococcaceae cyanobacterium MS004]
MKTSAKPRPRRLQEDTASFWGMAIASVAVTMFILALRTLGTLEWIELVTYDWMVRRQSPRPPDTRILVVGITEQDIQDRDGMLQFPDQVYADLFAKLLAAKPRAVGLDIWRDRPVEPGHAAFVQQLQRSDRIIGITKLGDANQPAIAPPKALPPEQIGFNDVLVDKDDVIRRVLLFGPEESTAFSLQLALRYLRDDKIESEASPLNPAYMRLGPTDFIPLQSSEGGYTNVDARGYQVLLTYRGGLKSIPMVSLGDVMQGRVPPEQIQNRIVLIGNVAESAKDFFSTPYSAGQTDDRRVPGVMVHAQMVSQFLDAATGTRPLRWAWPDGAEGLWILAWAVLGGLLAGRSRRPLFLFLATPLSMLGLLGACFFVFSQSGWIPLVPPGLAFLIAMGSVVAYSAQQAKQQQQIVMRLLGQSTSPEIAATLWQRRDELLENGQLPGQRLTATLLFTDLKGFSTIAEKYSPEQLLVWLNEYLDWMATHVQQHQGVINKFTGDGIMAVFGVPIAHEQPDEIRQDARHAVDCAIAMAQTLEPLNQRWAAVGLPVVEMRVGIFTGPVVVGSLGSRIRLEYGVIGDSVNIASRLESLDKDRQPSPCRILIAGETRDCLQEDYALEPWGEMHLKGKAVQVNVFRVLGQNLNR